MKFDEKIQIRHKRRNFQPYIFFLPAGLALIIIVIFPIVYSLVVSLLDIKIIQSGPSNFVGLKNFLKAFSDRNYLISFRNTFLFVGVVVSFELLVGMGLALFASQNIPGIRILRTILIVPAILAPIVIGLMWRYMCFKGTGILSYLLSLINFEPDTGILGSGIWASFAVYFADIWEWSGFMALIFLAGILSVPDDLYEAAKVDGASSLHMFLRITLPMMKPTILIALILRTMDAFCVYDIVWALTRGGPGMSTTMVSYQIYRTTIRYGELGYGSALAWLHMAVVVFVSVIYIRVAYRGEKI
jgi:multiple sugar transport system permease protein